MREAIASLTTRGRAFAAAGLAAAACAVVLGQADLLRVGVLLLALPLVAAYSVGRTRYKLASGRRIEPARVEAGQDARVVLRLENVSRLPTGLLLLEDSVPRALGAVGAVRTRPGGVAGAPRGRLPAAHRPPRALRGGAARVAAQ